MSLGNLEMTETSNVEGSLDKSDKDLNTKQSEDGLKLTRRGHRIPRPKNCFLSYRNEVSSKLIEFGIDNNSKTISKIVATLWRAETEDVKQRYRAIAEQEKLKHQRMYPDYKYMPRRKSSEFLYPEVPPPTKDLSTDNPPRKIVRKSLPPLNDIVERGPETRAKRKYSRSSVRKKAKNQKANHSLHPQKTLEKKRRSVVPYPKGATEPLYAKFILNKISEDATLSTLEDTEQIDHGPTEITMVDEPLRFDALDHEETNCPEYLNDDCFNQKSSNGEIETGDFLEQEAISVDSNLFLNSQGTANESQCIKETSEDWQPTYKIECVSNHSIDSDNVEDHINRFDPVHYTQFKVTDVSPSECLVGMDENVDTIDPSSLTSSPLNASCGSEVGDDLADKNIETLSDTPFYQELITIITDVQRVQEYFEKLSSEAETPLLPKVSAKILELALTLPAAWSCDWYEMEVPSIHADNTIQNCDVQNEEPPPLSLDDLIDMYDN